MAKTATLYPVVPTVPTAGLALTLSVTLMLYSCLRIFMAATQSFAQKSIYYS